MFLMVILLSIAVFTAYHSVAWGFMAFVLIIIIQTVRLENLKSTRWSDEVQIQELKWQRNSAEEDAKFWRFMSGSHQPATKNKEIKPN